MTGERKERARIHFGLVLAELLCVAAFVFELRRALSGNELSWAYVFEWPVFGLYAIYMWRKLLNEQRDSGTEVAGTAPSNEMDDARLSAWNEYLDRAHAHDREKNARKGPSK